MKYQTENYYEVLGLNSSASTDEIRRAYRILARRYHPDVNPGKGSEEKFKAVAHAYEVLSDADKRRKYDAERQVIAERSKLKGYHKGARTSARERFYQAQQQATRPGTAATKPQTQQGKPSQQPQRPGIFSKVSDMFSTGGIWSELKREAKTGIRPPPRPTSPSQISLVEVSVSINDALFGSRKTIEFATPEGNRKVSIRVPPGVRNGSVTRMRQRDQISEELVIIFRVPQHPFISIQQKGVVIEVPISVAEAISGATIIVPGIQESFSITISPGTQGGTELRVKEKGIYYPDGTRGDIFYRLVVKTPTCSNAFGLKDKALEMDKYYETPVRQDFPQTLSDL